MCKIQLLLPEMSIVKHEFNAFFMYEQHGIPPLEDNSM